jgi:hypothetical protein
LDSKVEEKPKNSPANPNPTSTKRELATLKQWIEILDWHHFNRKNQSATAHHFQAIYPNLHLKQPTISDWVKNETKWHEQWAECQIESDCVAK